MKILRMSSWITQHVINKLQKFEINKNNGRMLKIRHLKLINRTETDTTLAKVRQEIHKTLHSKPKVEQNEFQHDLQMISWIPKGFIDPVPLDTSRRSYSVTKIWLWQMKLIRVLYIFRRTYYIITSWNHSFNSPLVARNLFIKLLSFKDSLMMFNLSFTQTCISHIICTWVSLYRRKIVLSKWNIW